MAYDLLLQQALKLHQQGDLNGAERLYRQILQVAPRQPQILNLLGLIAQEKMLHAEAISCFTQAIEADCTNFEFYFNLGWSLRELGKNHEAVEAFNRVIKLRPQTKEAYNALGEIYASTAQNARAKQMFEQALAYDNAYLEAQINMAVLDNDLLSLQNLAGRYTTLPPVLAYNLALQYRRQKEYQLALDNAQLAADSSSVVQYQLLTAELYMQKDDKKNAELYYQKALAINPNCVPALINLANFSDDLAWAEDCYKKAISLERQNFDAHLNYAVLLQRQNRLSEALEEYRQAVIINPDSPEVCTNLGIIQRQLGDYVQALGLFFNALTLAPQNKQYALNVAETLVMYYRQDSEKALKIAENWCNSMPDNAFARHVYASFKGENIGSDFEYSQQLFDMFADNYEQTMQKINYCLPDKFAQIIGHYQGTIIDLGCGTGLLAEKLKFSDNSLIGVDISASMLAKAEAKKIYDRLYQQDIIDFCRHLPPQSLVVAGDVIGYIGDISELCRLVFPHKWIFSVATGQNKSKDFWLSEGGRYVYNVDYVKNVLAQSGYRRIEAIPLVIRSENGQDVEGAIWVATEDVNEQK